MNQVVEWSVEQGMPPQQFADRVRQMSREEAQACLIEFYERALSQEAAYKVLLGEIADLTESLAR